MAEMSVSVPKNNHGFCLGCDWSASPDDHRYASVHADATVHAMFSGHTVREGATEEIIEEVESR